MPSLSGCLGRLVRSGKITQEERDSYHSHLMEARKEFEGTANERASKAVSELLDDVIAERESIVRQAGVKVPEIKKTSAEVKEEPQLTKVRPAKKSYVSKGSKTQVEEGQQPQSTKDEVRYAKEEKPKEESKEVGGPLAGANAAVENMAKELGLEVPIGADPVKMENELKKVLGENIANVRSRVLQGIPSSGKVNELDELRTIRVIKDLRKQLAEAYVNLKVGTKKENYEQSKNIERIESELNQAMKINKAIGTIFGRGLRYRRELIGEDFTSEGILEKLRKNAGRTTNTKAEKEFAESMAKRHGELLAKQSKVERENQTLMSQWRKRVGKAIYDGLVKAHGRGRVKKTGIEDDISAPNGYGLSVQNVRNFLNNRGFTEGNRIKIVNSDELTPDGREWSARVKNGVIEINARRIENEAHFNDRLNHEIGHLASTDAEVRKHYDLLKRSLSKAEREQLYGENGWLSKYSESERPDEEAAEILRLLSKRKSVSAKKDSFLCKLKRSFKKITGSKLSDEDAMFIAADVMARAEGVIKKEDIKYAKEQARYAAEEPQSTKGMSEEEFNAAQEAALAKQMNPDAAIERAIGLSYAKNGKGSIEDFNNGIYDLLSKNPLFEGKTQDEIEQMASDFVMNKIETKKSLLQKINREKSKLSDADAKETEKIKARIESIRKRLDEGNFLKEPPEFKKMSDANYELKLQEDELRRDLYAKTIEARRENRPLLKKAADGLSDSLNLARSVMTGLDVSAVLRQGIFPTLANPVRSLKILPKMFKAMMSEDAQHKVMDEIRRRPNAQFYDAGGLFLKDPRETSPSAMEEAFMSRFTRDWPTWAGGGLVRGSERAYVTFLNRLRADVFDSLANVAHPDGQMNMEDAKAIANAANVLTGRGKIGFGEGGSSASAGLNLLFFAPNYVASIFNTMAGQPLYHGSGAVRKAVAGEYARFLGGAALIYALASMTMGEGDGIETDPRSSDFGRLRYGNTRLNPLGGLLQNTTLLSRIGTGQTKTLAGQIKDLRGPNMPYKSDSVWDVISRYARMKFSPVVSAAVNTATGTDVMGQPTSLGNEVGKMVTPLSLRDVQEAMQDQGIPKGTALAILSLFGMGVNSFNPNEPKK